MKRAADLCMDAKAASGIRGFSLIELLAVVIIVATLATVATPLYRKHAQQLRYLDGQTRLLELMGLEHRYYAEALAYTDNFEQLGLDGETANLSAHGHYRISAAACEDNLNLCVTLTASPTRHANAVMTLDSRGRRAPADVWR